jgi:hypothetical protein
VTNRVIGSAVIDSVVVTSGRVYDDVEMMTSVVVESIVVVACGSVYELVTIDVSRGSVYDAVDVNDTVEISRGSVTVSRGSVTVS